MTGRRSQLQVRDARVEDASAIHAFLADNGWAHRVGTPDDFALLLQRSQRSAVACDGDRVVGFARALTDGWSNGYLSMVAVAGEHRRKGLGSQLVEHVVGRDPQVTWVLRADREGASSFFSRLGFERSEVAMERPRSRTPSPVEQT